MNIFFGPLDSEARIIAPVWFVNPKSPGLRIQVLAMFDTGVSHCILLNELTERLKLEPYSKERNYVADSSGETREVTYYYGRAALFRTDPLTQIPHTHDTSVFVSPKEKFLRIDGKLEPFQAIVGRDFLKDGILTINPPDAKSPGSWDFTIP